MIILTLKLYFGLHLSHYLINSLLINAILPESLSPFGEVDKSLLLARPVLKRALLLLFIHFSVHHEFLHFDKGIFLRFKDQDIA